MPVEVQREYEHNGTGYDGVVFIRPAGPFICWNDKGAATFTTDPHMVTFADGSWINGSTGENYDAGNPGEIFVFAG